MRADSAQPTAFDPLRLCIFATVALLGWLLGPIALIFFAGLGFRAICGPAEPDWPGHGACCVTPGWCWPTWAC